MTDKKVETYIYNLGRLNESLHEYIIVLKNSNHPYKEVRIKESEKYINFINEEVRLKPISNFNSINSHSHSVREHELKNNNLVDILNETCTENLKKVMEILENIKHF